LFISAPFIVAFVEIFWRTQNQFLFPDIVSFKITLEKYFFPTYSNDFDDKRRRLAKRISSIKITIR
jgi:hypothetical protein